MTWRDDMLLPLRKPTEQWESKLRETAGIHMDEDMLVALDKVRMLPFFIATTCH